MNKHTKRCFGAEGIVLYPECSGIYMNLLMCYNSQKNTSIKSKKIMIIKKIKLKEKMTS